MSRKLAWIGIIALMAVASARCDHATDITSPGTPVTTSANPAVTGITPASLPVSAQAQMITVSGQNFVPGLTVLISAPTGDVVTLTGSQIQNVTASSFGISVVLSAAGTYGLSVINVSGLASNTLAFPVQAKTTIDSPTITGITPPLLVQSPTAQAVSITGTGFASNMTITVSRPMGDQVILTGSQIGSVSSTGMQFSAIFDVVGTYVFVVNSASGAASNSVSILVTAAPQSAKK